MPSVGCKNPAKLQRAQSHGEFAVVVKDDSCVLVCFAYIALQLWSGR